MLSNVASSIYVPTIPPTINYETNKKINLAAIHYHYAKFQQLYDDHHSFQVTLSVANISFLVTGTYNSNKSKQWWLGYGFAGTEPETERIWLMVIQSSGTVNRNVNIVAEKRAHFYVPSILIEDSYFVKKVKLSDIQYYPANINGIRENNICWQSFNAKQSDISFLYVLNDTNLMAASRRGCLVPFAILFRVAHLHGCFRIVQQPRPFFNIF